MKANIQGINDRRIYRVYFIFKNTGTQHWQDFGAEKDAIDFKDYVDGSNICSQGKIEVIG